MTKIKLYFIYRRLKLKYTLIICSKDPELFTIRNRSGFLKLLHLLILQSGGLLEYKNLSKESMLSHPTVTSHLEAMCIAHALFLVRPFHGGGSREIIRRPKCYAFDTGFVAYTKGWNTIREDDRGILWEHCVLDMLRTLVPDTSILYWRDKSEKEIDFILKKPENVVDTIECKINPEKFTWESLRIFRLIYPEGRNFIVCPSVKLPYQIRCDKLVVTVCGCQDLDSLLLKADAKFLEN